MGSDFIASRRRILISAGALLLAPAAVRAAQAADVFPDQTLMVDGLARRYRLVAPTSAGAKPPLMIALHGMLIDSPSLMPTYSGLDDMARAHGSVLVYPKSFEAGWPLSFGAKLQRELRFLDSLVSEMQRTRHTDPQRIYLLGMSNGGYFAVVVASRRSRYLAGLAVHSGTSGVMGFGFNDAQVPGVRRARRRRPHHQHPRRSLPRRPIPPCEPSDRVRRVPGSRPHLGARSGRERAHLVALDAARSLS